MNKTDKTRVIFRKFKDGGDIIALFPELPGDNSYSSTLLSYQRIGQHSAASVSIIKDTTPATTLEYTSLLEELKSLGYSPTTAKHITRHDRARRRVACRFEFTSEYKGV